jgi:transcription termination factor Rho
VQPASGKVLSGGVDANCKSQNDFLVLLVMLKMVDR